ncbi:MAG: type II secretion system protein [Kiritimatiellaeota bacterium]|nr:type II secretion system protein [Kiritimatiellota bacterium]
MEQGGDRGWRVRPQSRRAFAAHDPKPPPPSAGPAAFTLIEVVIALAVAAMLIAATASAMIGALRAETSARLQQRAGDLLQTLQTEAWLAAETNQAATNLPPDWISSIESVEQGEGTNLVFWTVWKIWPLSRPALTAALCRQEQNSQIR